jgi:two-component system, OmpR family, response regulator
VLTATLRTMGRREPAGIELLADPTRREIVARLAVHPCRPSVLARDLGLARSTITYHLRLLERGGIVWVLSYSVDHRSLSYALHPSALRRVIAWLAGTGLGLPAELDRLSGWRGWPQPTRQVGDGVAPPDLAEERVLQDGSDSMSAEPSAGGHGDPPVAGAHAEVGARGRAAPRATDNDAGDGGQGRRDAAPGAVVGEAGAVVAEAGGRAGHSGHGWDSQETLRKQALNTGMAAQPNRPSVPGARILVVDDEPSITDLLSTALRYMGYEVTVASTGMAALEAAAISAPHLVVLDVMLPDIDGFEVCRRLREQRDFVPVIFLSARDAEDDRVTGFVRGGDDYVTKPFSLEELTLRIRALLRRTGGAGADGDDGNACLRYRDLEMDEDRHQVWKADREVELSPTEFRLLRYFLLNPERVLSKQQILDHVWQYDFNGDDNVVETYVSYLRRKLDDSEPRLLRTVRGFGYVLRADGPRG